ncbi:hypothetical protein E2C01_079516 [Portunus trituberculatus]|uniref:Uncharacterized protein n=1 Tax=Portunus trituberculatus TaxID=210409 RepID=A0A5B7ITJ5_PORTR|nr:hypothetical protein [Portunus trituberculatus]
MKEPLKRTSLREAVAARESITSLARRVTGRESFNLRWRESRRGEKRRVGVGEGKARGGANFCRHNLSLSREGDIGA